MTSTFHFGLSKDLSLILNDADDYNVIIQVGENQNTKEFHAHSVILRARSPYFKSAFSSKWITKKNNMIIFNKPNIIPTVFDMILKYIYTGELDLTVQSGTNILQLLVATDELLLEELFKHVQDYLIEKQAAWVQRNFVLVLHTVFKLDGCKKLQDYCLEAICADPQPFITSKNFPLLDKNILYGLFKRDDLQIEEAVAWDCLIKWGIEQTPGLGNKNSNRAKWNNENYEALKETLGPFIPLIRFVELSPADYFDKVRPYKAVIPNHIYEEVEEFYFKGTLPKTTTLPPRTGTQRIESNIIKPKLSGIIMNWINGKDAKVARNTADPLYKFNLFYRMSRDGYDNVRDVCAGKGATLILFKVRYSGKVYGGYNPIGWPNKTYNTYQYYNSSSMRIRFNDNQNMQHLFTSESFIFSFDYNEDTKNMKISRVIEPSCAIYDFGSINFGGSDLSLNSNHSNNNNPGYSPYSIHDLMLFNDADNNNDCTISLYSNGHYEPNLGTGQYEVDDIEAFSVVRK